MVKFVIILSIFWIATFGYIIWHSLEENKKWTQFLSDHKCRPVFEIKSSTSPGFGVTTEGRVGTVFVNEPERKCWICDNGIQYCR